MELRGETLKSKYGVHRTRWSPNDQSRRQADRLAALRRAVGAILSIVGVRTLHGQQSQPLGIAQWTCKSSGYCPSPSVAVTRSWKPTQNSRLVTPAISAGQIQITRQSCDLRGAPLSCASPRPPNRGRFRRRPRAGPSPSTSCRANCRSHQVVRPTSRESRSTATCRRRWRRSRRQSPAHATTQPAFR